MVCDIGSGLFGAVKDLFVGVIDFLKGVVEIAGWLLLKVVQADEIGLMPEALEEDVTGIFTGIGSILKDPGNALEAIGQSTFDNADEKGIAYSVSYAAADTAIGFFGDKGLKKLGKADDLVKPAGYSDEAADAAKYGDEAADAATEAAERGDELAKAAEEAAGHADEGGTHVLPNAEDLKMSQTVQNHMNDVIKKGPNAGQLSSPYIDSEGTTLLLKEIMESTAPVPDAVLQSGLRWDVSGTFRGSTGTWELVVDTSTNTVVHFNFVSQ